MSLAAANLKTKPVFFFFDLYHQIALYRLQEGIHSG